LNCPVEEYVLESLPLIVAVLVLVAVLALWPGLVLFLPDAVM
jgi:TRAP-type C4-dicarboxylate transport system permease large subunit